MQELGLLGFLPAFRDDLGAGGFRSQELEKLVLAIANGGNRGTGSKTHLPRRSAPWHGALISSGNRSEEHTSELQSRFDLVCRLLLEKKNNHIDADLQH